MIYLHYKDTKTFGHSFSFLLIFKTLRASYLQVGNFSLLISAKVDKNLDSCESLGINKVKMTGIYPCHLCILIPSACR